MKITLNKVLLAIIAFLILILISGTTAGLVNRHNQKPEILISQGKAINLAEPQANAELTYYNLGTLRILPKAPEEKASQQEKSILILTPWISYAKDDTVFFEEISRKSGLIKGVFLQFFTSYSQKEILSCGEEKIKEELISEINKILALGKIQDIYFTDFLFL